MGQLLTTVPTELITEQHGHVLSAGGSGFNQRAPSCSVITEQASVAFLYISINHLLSRLTLEGTTYTAQGVL